MGFIEGTNTLLDLLSKLMPFLKWLNSAERSCDDYYYQEYNKKIYVKKNGDGMIVSSFILKVIDPSKVESLVRTLSIKDAKPHVKFDDFEVMKKRPTDKAFSEFGFWYQSDNNIVTDVEEYYDDNDRSWRNDNRLISIRLIIDTAQLEAGGVYHLSYAFSVPGMFPIENGLFDVANQDRGRYNDFRSHIATAHMGDHLRFSAYFEEGMDFKDAPKGFAEPAANIKRRGKRKNKVEPFACEHKNNIFYDKYHFEVKNPHEYSDIYMKWDVRNPGK